MSDKKEAEKKDSTTRRYEKSIDAASFLGGLTIALLVLLIAPSDNSFGVVFCSKPVSPFCNFITSVLKYDYYKQLLIGGIGIVSTLLVVSVVGVKVAYIQERDQKEFFPRVSLLFYEAGFIGVLILVPVLVLPFSLAMGYVIIFILIAWGAIYLWDYRRLRK
jgi:hypothetical protein